MFVTLLHSQPAVAPQVGLVLLVASHAVPLAVPSVWHVPLTVVVEPTHARLKPPGLLRSHPPPPVTIGATQVIELLVQNWLRVQGIVAHDAPAAGAAAHLPHAVPLGMAQYELLH